MKERFGPLVDCLLDGGIFLEESIELLERAMIAGALTRADGNRSKASRALGIHRNTMKRKIGDYQLVPVRKKPAARATRKSARNTVAS